MESVSRCLTPDAALRSRAQPPDPSSPAHLSPPRLHLLPPRSPDHERVYVNSRRARLTDPSRRPSPPTLSLIVHQAYLDLGLQV